MNKKANILQNNKLKVIWIKKLNYLGKTKKVTEGLEEEAGTDQQEVTWDDKDALDKTMHKSVGSGKRLEKIVSRHKFQNVI